MSQSAKYLGLIFWVGLSLSAALAGSQWMPGEWYVHLAKPSWNPPSWLFGPVWTLLYISMGVAAWLVWRRSGLAAARLALGAFCGQLALNALWSYLFFGAHRMGLAVVEIIVLWFAILVTALLFRRHSAPAAWLLVPYLLWVGFASSLTVTLWKLNT